ncbi:unnamed protein product [Hydatigera taeniaeformis]|uniref:Rbsn domain-containing protein n=1 Tax=Hydatigena taeniaeformis TaxID=6205 RepID=A0A0R3WZU4_HYDTA|nr:unnamed protein product [Hydatigera taeniaeformis]
MRSLGKAPEYEAQIQSQMHRIVQEMEEIDKHENAALAQLKLKSRSDLHQNQTGAN